MNKYDEHLKVSRVIESCETLRQTDVANRVMARFILKHRGPVEDSLGRDLCKCLDRTQRRMFDSEESFLTWAQTHPRWAHRVPQGRVFAARPGA